MVIQGYDLLTLQKEFFWIGIVLLLCGITVTASGFTIKKKALLRLRDDPKWYQIDNYYLRDPMWWFGSALVPLGQLFHIGAYGLAPLCTIAPLSALIIILKASFSRFIFYESLNVLADVGCIVSVLGSFLIVHHSPKLLKASLSKLVLNLTLPPSIAIITVYLLIAVSAGAYLKHVGYSKHLPVYTIMCTSIRTLTVICYKYSGMYIKEAIVSDPHVMQEYIPYIFLLCSIVCYNVHQYYFKKSSEIFNCNVVDAMSYLLFTTSAFLVSAVMFEEWKFLATMEILEIWLGFVFILIGIFLLYWFSVYSITWSNLKECFGIKDDSASSVGIDY